MHFQLAKEGWRVTFSEQDLKTPLRRRFVFQTPDKIREMAVRGGADTSLAGRQGIDYGISMGRGSVWLMLSQEQYQRLW